MSWISDVVYEVYVYDSDDNRFAFDCTRSGKESSLKYAEKFDICYVLESSMYDTVILEKNCEVFPTGVSASTGMPCNFEAVVSKPLKKPFWHKWFKL